MDGRAYNKLSDGKLIGVFNRTGRNYLGAKIRKISEYRNKIANNLYFILIFRTKISIIKNKIISDLFPLKSQFCHLA